MSGLAEESGRAYKKIDTVAGSLEESGISKRVIKLSPIGNVKGLVHINFLSRGIFLIILIALSIILIL